MAHPVPATRLSPAGIKMDDGFRCLVAFTADRDVAFWEKTVTPPGVDGGAAVNTTTMHNVDWRTKAPRQLAEMTDFSMKAAYDPAVVTSILTLLNVETTVTVLYPNGGKLAFFGFLQKFDPSDLQEGTQPEATITVSVTNQDPITGAEEPPVYVAPT